MRLTIPLVLMMLLAGSGSAELAPASAAEEVRLLEYVLDDTVLSEALVGYAGPGEGTLLPLGGSALLIDVAITVDVEAKTAKGFVLDEKRTFRLDVGKGMVTVSGRSHRFDRALVRVFADDIYVDSTLLGEWLPAAFDVELFALRVRVRPREPLPLQMRLDRERRVRHWRLRLTPDGDGYRPLATAYRLFDAPSVDQTVRLTFQPEQLHASYATYATGDFLYMESEAYLSGDDADPFDDWRLTLRRRDVAGMIGGPLRATEFAVGHIFHPASALLSATVDAAPGILLTNAELYRPTEFDRHSLRGNLPPGWDVELYHNGTLIDYRQSRPDGQYAFDDVPLLFGMNFFRLIFYGPQGQRREEEHRFLLGDSLTKPRRLEYRLAATAAGHDQYRGSLFLSYGVARNLTATAEVAELPTPSGQRRYAKGGARVFWSALFAYGDYAVDSAGGSAYETGIHTRVAGFNITAARTGIRDGYVSEAVYATGGGIVSRDRVRIDTAIPASWFPRVPLSVEMERQQLASGFVRTTLHARGSVSYKGLSISNRLLRTAMTGQRTQTEGGLQFSRYVRRVGVRGEVLYAPATRRINSANISLERSIGAGYRLYASVAHSFLDGGHVFTVGIDKSSGSFAAGVETRVSADGESVGNINLSAGLGRDPHLEGWMASARSRAGFGAISARVFLDRNRNDVFDAGDQPLEGVAFTVNGVERPERTASNGVAQIRDLSPHAAANMAIVAHSLEDPQWDPVVAGVRVMPRAGKVASADIAVIGTAEVEGNVTRMRGGGGSAEALPGIAIEVVNEEGKVAAHTLTSYDGYYVVSKVRPGRYTVRVADAKLAALARIISVGNDDQVIGGVDFRFAEAPRGPAPGTVAPIAAPAGRPRFVVQLGAFTVRANAEGLVRRARQGRIDHRGALYFVEAGPFGTQLEADAARAAFAREGIASIVRAAR